MLDRDLILFSLPVGLVLGLAVWAASGQGAQTDALQAAADQLQAMRPAIKRVDGQAMPSPMISPIFAQADQGAAPVEISVALQGVSRSGRRQAALIAIGGQPADWLTVGETRGGVTLEAVRANGVTITTANGPRELGFGPSTVTTPGSMAPGGEAGPAPGSKGPPPPASAPGAP